MVPTHHGGEGDGGCHSYPVHRVGPEATSRLEGPGIRLPIAPILPGLRLARQGSPVARPCYWRNTSLPSSHSPQFLAGNDPAPADCPTVEWGKKPSFPLGRLKGDTG